MHGGAHGLLLEVDDQVGLGGGLVRVVDAGEALDLAGASLLVDATLVRLLAVLERGCDVHEVEVAELLDELTSALAVVLVGSDGGRDDGGSRAGQLAGDEGNALDVLAAVLAAEAELGRELVADSLAQEQRDRTATLLVQCHLQGAGDGVLAAVLVARQEDGETLLRARRVRLAQHLDDLRVGEPLRDVTAASEARAQLGAGDVEGAGLLGDCVDGGILVAVGQVGHHLEGDDLDAELLAVLLDSVLRVVGAVEVNALAVLTGSGVVTANNEVGGTVVLADNGVPDGLTRATHTHSQGQKTQNTHAVGVSRQKSLVNTDTGEVVDITGLGQAHNGVDQDVGAVRPGGADSQFTVSAVHGVSGLESDDSGPAELVEV